MINRRSARFMVNNYNNTSSVSTMLDTLQCPSQICRENQRLVLMYKIVHGLVALPSNKLIPADGRTKSNHSSLTQVQDHQFIDISLQEFLLSAYYIPAWNSLSCTTVDSNTLDSLKAHLYK